MGKKQLQQRLEGYWRIELFNVGLLPATAVFVLLASDQTIGPQSILCLMVMSALLIAGGCYWRAKARKFKQDQCSLQRTLYWLDRLQLPMLISVVAVLFLCLCDLLFVRISLSQGDRIVSILATALAILEYVNYYHRQLQHFDHWRDFLRLISGRGFRKSHLRADLDRFRGCGRPAG